MIGVIRFIVTVIIKILYRVKVTGEQNVPKTGPAIICANHNGMLDMFFIGFKLKRLVHYMAKEELFRHPLLAAVIRYLGAFPVKRGSGDVRAIKTAFKLLNEGHIIGMFPEGTRTRGKRRSEIKIKPGLALFAIKSKVPIIPVAIKGNYLPFSKIKVVFGDPICLNKDKDRRYSTEEMTHISQNIMNTVYSLLEAN